MSWLYFTLLAYLINAFAFVVDKYLLVTHIPRPFAYAFWVAVLSASAVVLIPFGVVMQSAAYFAIALTSGGAFFVALIFLYKAIKASDISVASTMAGVATAVFSYFLAIPLLGESSGVLGFATIAMLIIGMLFLGRTDRPAAEVDLSLSRGDRSPTGRSQRTATSALGRSIWAGLFFGISFVFMKISFDLSDFINGLFWTRVGFVGAALVSLMFGPFRRDVFSSLRGARVRVGAMFIGNKLLAASGFLLLYYAIRLGEVSVVNSLLGFQFLFIFILALLLRSKVPRIEEHVDKRNLTNKILGIGFVIAGFLAVIWLR